jgi:hypothetical protein
MTRYTVQGSFQAKDEPFVCRAWLRDLPALHFHRSLQNEGSIRNWLESKLPWRMASPARAVLALPSASRHWFDWTGGASLFCVRRAV